MKISDYTEQTSPSASAYVVVALGNQNYKVSISDLYASAIIGRFTSGYLSHDLLGESLAPYPCGWSTAAVLGSSKIASIPNHPGIVRIASGAAADTKGGLHWGAIPFVGQMQTDIFFRMQSLTDENIVYGFVTPEIVISPYPDIWRGIYFDITGALLSGKTRSGALPANLSTTITTYTLLTGVWYRAHLRVGDDRSRVDYYLYDANGLLLWSDYLTANIPPASTAFASNLYVTKTTAGAVNLIDVDFLSFNSPKALVR